MRIITLLAMIFSFNVLAATVEQARELYATRAADESNALKAADIYRQLADEAQDPLQKLVLKTSESEALYYVGEKYIQQNKKDDAIVIFERAHTSLGNTITAVENRTDLTENEKEVLAHALYFFGANLGKWGQTRGVAASLFQWPTLRDRTNEILKLKKDYVNEYGAYRILGRGYWTIPPLLGGDKVKALKYLQKAYANTLNDAGVCKNGTTNIYYADALVSDGKVDEAKKILQDFIQFVEKNGPAALNADKVPEILDELAENKKALSALQ